MAPETERTILQKRGDEDNTTCYLCQQQFTTPRRLRVHIPQHFITTFCPCGEYSYHRDYVLRHQRTMNCFTGHIFDVDELSYPRFLELIQPFVQDPSKLERLLQRFPVSRAITQRPVLKPPSYQKPRPPTLPSSLPRIVLQRVDSQSSRKGRARRSPFPTIIYNYINLSQQSSHCKSSRRQANLSTNRTIFRQAGGMS